MRRLSVLVAVLAIGCSSHSGAAPVPNKISPEVLQRRLHSGWVHTALPKHDGHLPFPSGLAVDTYQNVWASVSYNNQGVGAIDKIAMDRQITSYPLLTTPEFITVGSDQNLWITGVHLSDDPGIIARVTPDGVETEFKVAPGMYFNNIVSGPDGALWFPECNKTDGSGGIGTITTTGTYKSYSSVCQENVVSGPDGNIWFGNGPTISTMTPQGVVVAQYPVGGTNIHDLIVGADGALYMTGLVPTGGTDLIRLDTSGTVTHLGTDSYRDAMHSVVNGPDDSLWMIGKGGTSNYLVSFNLATQSFATRTLAPYGSTFGPIVAGPDNEIWGSTDTAGSVDTYILQVMMLSPKPLTVSLGHTANLNVGETNYFGQWTAESKNPSIAGVDANSSGGTFVVTGVGVGTAFLTVYDSMFNSITEKVTVR